MTVIAWRCRFLRIEIAQFDRVLEFRVSELGRFFVRHGELEFGSGMLAVLVTMEQWREWLE